MTKRTLREVAYEILPVGNSRTECRLGGQFIIQKTSIWCSTPTKIVQDQRTEVGQKLTSCPVAILNAQKQALIIHIEHLYSAF